LAVLWPAWPDFHVRVGSSDLVRTILALASALPAMWSWSGALAWAKGAVGYLSRHTGVPALLVAAVLVAVGYRVLKRTARFAVEVAAVALVLAAASELGWIRW
jgi:hypothetical protein